LEEWRHYLVNQSYTEDHESLTFWKSSQGRNSPEENYNVMEFNRFKNLINKL